MDEIICCNITLFFPFCMFVISIFYFWLKSASFCSFLCYCLVNFTEQLLFVGVLNNGVRIYEVCTNEFFCIMRFINSGANLVCMVSTKKTLNYFALFLVSSIQLCEKVICFAFVSLLQHWFIFFLSVIFSSESESGNSSLFVS